MQCGPGQTCGAPSCVYSRGWGLACREKVIVTLCTGATEARKKKGGGTFFRMTKLEFQK